MRVVVSLGQGARSGAELQGLRLRPGPEAWGYLSFRWEQICWALPLSPWVCTRLL